MITLYLTYSEVSS